jgi:hypothetical protein
MSTAKVWRFGERTWKGAPTITPEQAYLGEVEGVILGGQAARGLRGFPGLQDTTGQAAFPKDATVQVQPGDRIEISGVTYAVTGPEEWSETTIFGTDFGYRWLTIESTSN